MKRGASAWRFVAASHAAIASLGMMASSATPSATRSRSRGWLASVSHSSTSSRTDCCADAGGGQTTIAAARAPIAQRRKKMTRRTRSGLLWWWFPSMLLGSWSMSGPYPYPECRMGAMTGKSLLTLAVALVWVAQPIASPVSAYVGSASGTGVNMIVPPFRFAQYNNRWQQDQYRVQQQEQYRQQQRQQEQARQQRQWQVQQLQRQQQMRTKSFVFQRQGSPFAQKQVSAFNYQPRSSYMPAYPESLKDKGFRLTAPFSTSRSLSASQTKPLVPASTLARQANAGSFGPNWMKGVQSANALPQRGIAQSLSRQTDSGGTTGGATRSDKLKSAFNARATPLNVAFNSQVGSLTKSKWLVVGRLIAFRQPNAMRFGEKTLMPEMRATLGSPQANWERNTSLLRRHMKYGTPIRDLSYRQDDNTLVPTQENPTRRIRQTFTGMERNLLRNHGWVIVGEYWYPPKK